MKFTEKYPPTRFKRSVRQMFEKRATVLAKERGLETMSIPDYLTEASQYFEDHRPKAVAH